MFLGLLDPDPYPFVRGMDPDPSVIKEYIKKNLGTLFYFLFLKNDVNVQSYKQKQKSVFKNCFFVVLLMVKMKISGSGCITVVRGMDLRIRILRFGLAQFSNGL
jgi:hypothetical protein